MKNNDILDEINKLRDELNLLMKNNYKKDYKEVLNTSLRLDKLIVEYLKKNENLQ